MEAYTKKYKTKRDLFHDVDEILEANGLYYIEQDAKYAALTYWYHDSEIMYRVLKGPDNDAHLKFTTFVGEDTCLYYIKSGDVLVFEREEQDKVWFWCPKLLIGHKALDTDEAYGFVQLSGLSYMIDQGIIAPTSCEDKLAAEASLQEMVALYKAPLVECGSFKTIEKVFKKLKGIAKDICDVTRLTTPEKEESIRTLKVKRGEYHYSFAYQDYYKEVPEIHLRGLWLEQAGFMRGESVQVITLNGMIVIVPQRPPKNLKAM